MRERVPAGRFLTIAALILFFATPAAARIHKNGLHEDAACGTCHVKANPTPGDSELRSCPAMGTAAKKSKITKSVSGEPDVAILNELVDKYGPVRFSHKSHADMAQMGDSCWLCHHNSPADRPHPACKTCHKVNLDPRNPARLRLKAAYHRHCIDCHRKWSHENNCLLCHARRTKENPSPKAPASPYPPLKQPGKMVYKTKYHGTVVTFFHTDHTKLFRIPCENCHVDAPCEECHDRKRTKPAVKPGHETCSKCHDTVTKSQCVKCHRNQPMPSYTHNATGFPLKTWHAKLECSACHHAHKPIRKLNSDCRTCHKGLQFKRFDHGATGFSLKPWHAKLSCEKCHVPSKPMRALNPNCASCHKGGIKGFNHARTGFPLKAWHAKLACTQCHPTGKPVHALKTDCDACHKNMTFSNFNHADVGFPLKSWHVKLACDKCHTLKPFSAPKSADCAGCHKPDSFKSLNHAAVIGVKLDDIHSSLSCADCHTKGFQNPPDCSGCHNDKSWPKDKPSKD